MCHLEDYKVDWSREDDEIVRRRFGSRHEKPCNDPGVLTCAKWECQVNDCCQWQALKTR